MDKEIALISAQGLSFTYPDGTCVLEDINLRIKKGEFLGILGANGSGKTTLLKLLNCLLKATGGNVYLEGKDIRFLDRDKLFTRVCTMFQNPDDQLFSPTVAQDIAFGPKNMGLAKEEVQRRTDYALEAVGLSEFGHKTISGLSYGQKKRVCLAGVLAMRPELILLDEPTASLDPMGVSSIMHLLKDLSQESGVTLVMTTHSVDLVPIFIDRAIVLNRGRLVKEGSPQEVFADTQELRAANLRLTQIGHLFEILKKKDALDFEYLPLTIGEARREIKELLNKL